MNAADANRLNKLIRKAGSVLGVELEEDAMGTIHCCGQCLSSPVCHIGDISEHLQLLTEPTN